jgi:hypothetical protein
MSKTDTDWLKPEDEGEMSGDKVQFTKKGT